MEKNAKKKVIHKNLLQENQRPKHFRQEQGPGNQ